VTFHKPVLSFSVDAKGFDETLYKIILSFAKKHNNALGRARPVTTIPLRTCREPFREFPESF
jgi:hypothetical protein